jgi:hypothetical protein
MDELIGQAREAATAITTHQVQPEPIRIEPDVWPMDTVWIMNPPNRRGPGRVSDITALRSMVWKRRYEACRAGRLSLSEIPRYSATYTRPDRMYGSVHGYHWWFLGWHSNGHPMFAVKMTVRITEEADIRRVIRNLIAGTVTRLQCNYCWSTYPSTSEWPIPANRAGTVTVSGTGSVNVCGACTSTWHTCSAAGCRQRGRNADMYYAYTDPHTTLRDWICYDHVQGTPVCSHCGERFISVAVLNDHNCIGSANPWERCTVCNRQTRQWALVTLTDGTRQPVCNSSRRCLTMLRECALCHNHARTWFTMGPTSSVAPDGNVCAQCATAAGVDDCEHCGMNHVEADDHNCWSGGRCRCDRCMGRVIRSYSYKPRARFQGTDKHGLYLGMELEIIVDLGRDVNSVARQVQEVMGRTAYIKSDASVAHGFEIVTHPMSYEYAMSSFPWRTLEVLRSHNSYATDGTGIHIHASRKGFSGPAHEYRWMIFLYRNQRQAQVIARRISGQWAAFSEDQRRAAKDIVTKKKRDNQRYRAINQLNSETIEIRIFQSSTDDQAVKATLGLVHASIEYTRAIRSRDVIRDDAWSWKAFAKWVKARDEYAPLYAEMVRLNVASDEPTEPTESDPMGGYGSGYSVSFGCDYDCAGTDVCAGRCTCGDCDETCTDGSSDEDW